MSFTWNFLKKKKKSYSTSIIEFIINKQSDF